MAPKDRIQEKREFLRLYFASPVRFITCPSGKPAAEAVTGNISQSGVLFQTKIDPPAISSILWINIDFRTLKICQEIESTALVINQGVLGKVVRIEANTLNPGLYDVGVCFLTRDQQNSREVQAILNTIK